MFSLSYAIILLENYLYVAATFCFQVCHLLKDVDANFIRKLVIKTDSIFLNCFSVTPNCHRVTEVTHAFSSGQRLSFVSICFLQCFLDFIHVFYICSHRLVHLSCCLKITNGCRMNGLGLTKNWLISEG